MDICLRGVEQDSLSSAASAFAKEIIKIFEYGEYFTTGISFVKGFVRGWNEYGK
ncbi:hypothetical protein [Caldicellulosiruptor changbaiensis]|jgi:hypothetical protein|uniref:Uncharacterized protein n=1 Tax=Caldicellulosiruptor diazotrophicus TaxID=2806205 RepID=A0ABN6EEM5_9FIRM|nr:hypothetical protein [Caldicellulosiruptor changbaiensis]BCS82204.1 hypothetical protein CaldiYA01_21640 [Caldicellulosiruptor diazotrophicus]